MRRTTNKIPKLHVRKGDTVKVLSGDDKGKTGEVLRVSPLKQKAIVQGINVKTKFVKANPNGGNPGDIMQVERPIAVCKLMVLDPKSGKPRRYKKTLVNGKWQRTFAK